MDAGSEADSGTPLDGAPRRHPDHRRKRYRPLLRHLAVESRDGFLTRDDLHRAEPIHPTAAWPHELIREFQGDEETVLGPDRRLIPFEDLPHSERTEFPGMRPEWLGQNYIASSARSPIAPAIIAAAAELGVVLPQRLLSYHPDEELFDRSYPWSTIGRVFVGTNANVTSRSFQRDRTSSATGFMVGPRIMVTASHVAPWASATGWMRFVPSYWGNIAGTAFTQPFGSAWVEELVGVPHDGSSVTGEDVVVCKLSRRLGDATGWLARWRWFDDDEYYNWPYTSVGYPGIPYGGERPVVQHFVAIEDVDDDGQGKELETMEFTSPGWSGGPLFFWRGTHPWAVGADSGTETDLFDPRRSVFSGGKRFTDLIDQAELDWP